MIDYATETQMSPGDIKTAIETAQDRFLREKSHRDKWRSIRASGIGDPCARRIYYEIANGELEALPPDLIAIFEEGKDQEPGVRRFLSELGFEVEKAQVTADWPELRISGMIDGVTRWNGRTYIVEIKTVSPYAWDKLQTAANFDEGYYVKWKAQLQIYMLLSSVENGIFVLKSKEAKKLRVVPMDLDYAFAETLLKRAETVRDALDSNDPPPYLKGNLIECKRCVFYGKLCTPPMDFGDVIPVVEDETLAAKLTRRESLSSYRSEYESLDREIKEQFKGTPKAICGDFLIQGKSGIRHMKATVERDVETWTMKIERLAEEKTV